MNKEQQQIRYRIGRSKAFGIVVMALVILAILPLFAILGYIIKEGVTHINWGFLTSLPKPVGESGGGIANALVGSLIIVAGAAVLAIPVGILCGIYLSEHSGTRLAYWSRLATDILQGIPSIVIGIVIYFWVVKPMRHFSAFSGSVALAIMMLPIVIRSTEETLRLLPSTLKEAAYALGMPYHRVVLKVVLPCGISGIISGIMLSVARVAGETAPLLFTAFGNPYLTTNITQPMQSLPLLIFNYATSPYDDWHNLAWGAAFILLVWVLSLNILTKLIMSRWKVQF